MAAAERLGNSIKFTAVTDTYAGQIVCIGGISFEGTGLTVGHIVRLLDDAGDVIADYAVEATTDSADLWGARPEKFYMGLKSEGTVGGTWKMIIHTA